MATSNPFEHAIRLSMPVRAARRSELAIIAIGSLLLAFTLIGRQVFYANWGLIDDHGTFAFLGTNPRLPFSDIWNTLLTKTEIGDPKFRFRPTLYILWLLEAAISGSNVHLWYLARTLGFAFVIAGTWYICLPLFGLLLGGLFALYIALLPLWTGIWSRLMPSEIYGAVCTVGILVSASVIFSSQDRFSRNLGATAIAVLTLVMLGTKETFLPLAGISYVALLFAWWRNHISRAVFLSCALTITVFVICLLAFLLKAATGTTDFYGEQTGIGLIVYFAARGFLFGGVRVFAILAIPVLLFLVVDHVRKDAPPAWQTSAVGLAVASAYMLLLYASQWALYRTQFPVGMRYDFPAMLLVPVTLGLAIGYVCVNADARLSNARRAYVRPLLAVALIIFAVTIRPKPSLSALQIAVNQNIERTSLFFKELTEIVHVAKQSPTAPIILESYEGAYEQIFSLVTYFKSFAVTNPVAIRIHTTTRNDPVLEGLVAELRRVERGGGGRYTALGEIDQKGPQGCISVGIDGDASADCRGFRIDTKSIPYSPPS